MRTFELQQIFQMTQGLTYGRHASDAGQPFNYLQVSNLRDGRIDDQQEMKQETLSPEAANPYIPRQGMLLVTLRTQDLRAAVVPQDMPTHVVSNNLTLMHLNDMFAGEIRPEFIALVLRSDVVRQRLSPLYRGSGLPMISLKDFRQLKVGVPDLAVQDAFITARQALHDQEQAYEALLALRRRELEAHVSSFASAGAGA